MGNEQINIKLPEIITALRHPIKIPIIGKIIAASAPPIGKEVLQIPVAVLRNLIGNHSVIPLLVAEGFMLIPSPVMAASRSRALKVEAIECKSSKNPTNTIPQIMLHLVPFISTNRPLKILKEVEAK